MRDVKEVRHAPMTRVRSLIVCSLIFITACITSIDAVIITGVFSDPQGQQPLDAMDLHDTVFIGVHVAFTFNPWFEADPPRPQARIALTYRVVDSNGVSQPLPFGIFFTSLFPDGDYTLFVRATATGLFDAGDLESAGFPVRIRNLRDVSAPAPGPNDAGDPGNPPPDSGAGPPETCPGPDGEAIACPGGDGGGDGGGEPPPTHPPKDRG